jgi:hypothetical protein
MSAECWNSLNQKSHSLLGYGTINGDLIMEYVMSCNITNGSTAGNGVLCGSMLIVMLCNNRGLVGHSVFCCACPETVSRGPMRMNMFAV